MHGLIVTQFICLCQNRRRFPGLALRLSLVIVHVHCAPSCLIAAFYFIKPRTLPLKDSPKFGKKLTTIFVPRGINKDANLHL